MANIVVDTGADVVDANDGVTSLREALAQAATNAGADEITFANTVSTINLTSGLTISGNQTVTINGDTNGDGDGDVAIRGDLSFDTLLTNTAGSTVFLEALEFGAGSAFILGTGGTNGTTGADGTSGGAGQDGTAGEAGGLGQSGAAGGDALAGLMNEGNMTLDRVEIVGMSATTQGGHGGDGGQGGAGGAGGEADNDGIAGNGASRGPSANGADGGAGGTAVAGIWNAAGATVTLIDSVFDSNLATSAGGAGGNAGDALGQGTTINGNGDGGNFGTSGGNGADDIDGADGGDGGAGGSAVTGVYNLGTAIFETAIASAFNSASSTGGSGGSRGIAIGPGAAGQFSAGVDGAAAQDGVAGAEGQAGTAADAILDAGTATTPPATIVDAVISLYGDVTVTEGDTGSQTVTFSILRSGDLSESISVGVGFFGSASVTADDFVGGVLPGGLFQLTFGQSVQTVSFEVAGDTLYESDETFELRLTALNDPTGGPQAGFGTQSLFGSILNDDTAPTPTENADNLVFADSAETIDALGGDDTITGGGGDDTIEGGAGQDHLVYFGQFDTFKFHIVDAKLMITDDDAADGGDEGTDSVNGFEFITFADGTIGDVTSNASGVRRISFENEGEEIATLSANAQGTNIYTEYQGGQRVAKTVTYDPDAVNAPPWAEVRSELDALGNLVTKTIQYNDGTTRTTQNTFEQGILTQTVVTDGEGAASRAAWSDVSEMFNPDGTLAQKRWVYDDGTTYQRDFVYENGVLVQRIETDGDGAESRESWSTRVVSVTAQGDLARRDIFWDSGDFSEVLYENGRLSMRTDHDLDGSSPNYDRRIRTYDEDGNVLTQTFEFDIL